jgi:protein-tyrosine phosphatase
MKCDRVTGNLFLGPSPFEPAELEQLRSLGITAILTLQTEEDGKQHIEWEKTAAAAAGLLFRNIPVNDFDIADLVRKLPESVLALETMLNSGHTVYLHCTAGVSRSPTVAAAYLHWRLGWQLEQALVCIRTARDCSPNAAAIQAASSQPSRSTATS